MLDPRHILLADQDIARFATRRSASALLGSALGIEESVMGLNWQNRGSYIREWCNMLGVEPSIDY